MTSTIVEVPTYRWVLKNLLCNVSVKYFKLAFCVLQRSGFEDNTLVCRQSFWLLCDERISRKEALVEIVYHRCSIWIMGLCCLAHSQFKIIEILYNKTTLLVSRFCSRPTKIFSALHRRRLKFLTVMEIIYESILVYYFRLDGIDSMARLYCTYTRICNSR